MKYSGSSGIRMKWGEELIDMARDLGTSLGSIYERVIIASDFRETTDALKSTMIGALLSAGSEVYDAGKIPTPTLAYGAKDFDIGIMVTASHNPPEYNGIKLWNPDGSAFTEKQMNEISGDGGVAEWNSVGKLRYADALRRHMDAIIESSEGFKGLKVVVDCSNGASSVISPYVLRKLGAEVLTMNCHPDGSFPGHPSEPSEENLELLKRMVVKRNAIGIAHDGDADRFIAISPSGRYLDGDKIMAVFIKEMGFRKVVVPVNSSMLIDRLADVIRCPVGDANVSWKIKETGYEFGGEQSGTQIFADWRYTPDAIYSAVKFAEIAYRSDIDEILNSFPEYVTLRKSIYYTDMAKMEERIERFMEGRNPDRTDGWRVDMKDLWFLIRFSGTEPKVRITVEAENREEAERMMNEIMEALGGE